MPKKNVKTIATYLTEEQIEIIKSTGEKNVSALIRNLLKKYVEELDLEWPDSPGRGEYKRKSKGFEKDTKAIRGFWSHVPGPHNNEPS